MTDDKPYGIYGKLELEYGDEAHKIATFSTLEDAERRLKVLNPKFPELELEIRKIDHTREA